MTYTNRDQTFRELNRRPSKLSEWFSEYERTIAKSALAALAIAGCVAFGASLKRTPVELRGAEYTGVTFNKEDGNNFVYFLDNHGVKSALINDAEFDGMKEQTGNRYDVHGYKTFWSTHATNIVSSRK